MVYGDPGVRGKPLHKGNQELNAAIPVSQEQDTQDEVDYPRNGRVGIEQLKTHIHTQQHEQSSSDMYNVDAA